MVIIFYRSDGRGFVVWGRACNDVGSFCRDACGGLGKQSGTRLALPARHNKSMSFPTLAPAELVYICTVQVLFPSRTAGIAPLPFFSIETVCSFCTWPVIPRNMCDGGSVL